MKSDDYKKSLTQQDAHLSGSCRRLHPATALIVSLMVCGLAGPAFCAEVPAESPAQVAAQPVADEAYAVTAGAEETLGVHIHAVRLSAAGFMLDLRYRVLDAAKAEPLLNRKIAPYLQASSGARLGLASSPKIGQLRSTRRGEIHLDRDYSMLFGNPGRYLQKGSKVTLALGDHKVENLTVE